MTIQSLRQTITESLKKAFTENPKLKLQLETASLDSDVIISHFLKKDRTWIMFHRDYEVPAETEKSILDAAKKRTSGLPVAYITNTKEFFVLDFYVDENVLIPKPDTELLVELAVDWIHENTHKNLSILDMCSGSGCVGISIAHELLEQGITDFNITFADISEKALAITKLNAERLLGKGISPLRFIQTNLFESVNGSYNLIVTNPPYVPHAETMELLEDGRSEPVLALDGDVDSESHFCGSNDGLSLIRRLVPQCYEHLASGGKLIMETGEYNAEETAELFKAAGFKNVFIEKDMNNMLRDVLGSKE